MAASRGVIVPPGDPVRTYTPEEEEALTRNLHALLERVHEGAFSTQPLGPSLLASLHREIFAGVRDHAGRLRSVDFGSEYLTFGPHRSAARREVTPALAHVFEHANRSVASLEAQPDHPEYEQGAIQVAAWLHAELIRIHPFEDGNGRSTRALMNCVLVRLGLLPIPLEAPRQEYLDALNHFFRQRDFRPLLDLAIRLYVEASLS